MAVYVDNMKAKFGRMIMCHMVADTEQELAEMAKAIGVNLKWWQYKGKKKSHFDICLAMREKAVKLGAVEITVSDLGCMMWTRDNPNKPFGTVEEGRRLARLRIKSK